MGKLEVVSLSMFIIGILFLIFGWTQSWSFGADSSEFDEIFIARTVKTYVFIINGIILMLLGLIFEVIDRHFKSLESKISNLSDE
ncbi:hypothetical protein [Bacillus fonticola]|uniref:hypothetical protein n=1 Tax=Bacillus fonticola TaxID=2728853 RepID=UPI00147421FA|nr:hypothetical protein [Bacillus fonticola]